MRRALGKRKRPARIALPLLPPWPNGRSALARTVVAPQVWRSSRIGPGVGAWPSTVHELLGGVGRKQPTGQDRVRQLIEAAFAPCANALGDQIGGSAGNEIARPSAAAFAAVEGEAGRADVGNGLGQGADTGAGAGRGLEHGGLGARLIPQLRGAEQLVHGALGP